MGMKKTRFAASCAFCGHSHGRVNVYRDPFGTALAPGQWPNLTMHSNCFLAYLRDRLSSGPPSNWRSGGPESGKVDGPERFPVGGMKDRGDRPAGFGKVDEPVDARSVRPEVGP
jgi:hypothetical protein